MAPLLDYFNLFIYFIFQDYIHHLLTDLMILWIYVINTLFTMYPQGEVLSLKVVALTFTTKIKLKSASSENCSLWGTKMVFMLTENI